MPIVSSQTMASSTLVEPRETETMATPEDPLTTVVSSTSLVEPQKENEEFSSDKRKTVQLIYCETPPRDV